MQTFDTTRDRSTEPVPHPSGAPVHLQQKIGGRNLLAQENTFFTLRGTRAWARQ